MSKALSPQRFVLKHVVLLVASLVLFLGIAPIHSQADANDPPLIVSAAPQHSFDLDLYAYTGAGWQRLTADGCQSGLRLSPDATQLVYLTAPSFACGPAADEAGTGYLTGAGWDVNVLDLATGESRTFADQPSDVKLPDVHGAVTRSLPVWSPDGKSLAWTEQIYPGLSAPRLVVADVATGDQRVLDAALPDLWLSEDGLSPFLTWGDPAIVVFTNDPEDGAETLRIYDPAGGEPQVIRMPDDLVQDWYPRFDLVWTLDGDREVLLTSASSAVWYEVDAATGQVSPWMRKLILEPVSAAPAALSLTWNPFAIDTLWQLTSADGAVLQSWPPDDAPQRFAIAPSGQAVAELDYGSLYLWRDGSRTQLTLPDDLYVRGVVWGVLRWRAGEAVDSIG